MKTLWNSCLENMGNNILFIFLNYRTDISFVLNNLPSMVYSHFTLFVYWSRVNSPNIYGLRFQRMTAVMDHQASLECTVFACAFFRWLGCALWFWLRIRRLPHASCQKIGWMFVNRVYLLFLCILRSSLVSVCFIFLCSARTLRFVECEGYRGTQRRLDARKIDRKTLM